MPQVQESENCPDLSQIPANVTHKEDLPNSNYALIGFAPWISGGCSQLFLKAVSTDTSTVRAFVFYTPDPAAHIPARTHASWAGVSFKNLDFPIYAIQGLDGVRLMGKVAEYSGNMSDAWEAHDLASYYNATDYARVFMEVDTGNWSYLVFSDLKNLLNYTRTKKSTPGTLVVLVDCPRSTHTHRWPDIAKHALASISTPATTSSSGCQWPS